MKLLRFNKAPLEIPSEIILDVDFVASNMLTVTTTVNTIEYGHCLQFGDEPLPINIATYREPIGEWFVKGDKVNRIVADSTTLRVYFNDNKSNVCECCRFC